MERVGKLIMFIGPMFSNKTTELLGKLNTCADVGMRVAYITHKIDTRSTEAFDASVTTHSSQFKGLSHKIKPYKLPDLTEVPVERFDVIGVDETNFFTAADLERVVDWVETQNKVVYVAGLDGDAFRKPIGPTFNLIPYADEVYKLTGFCRPCLERSQSTELVSAPFTARLTKDRDQIVVGGDDIYIPLCRRCYLQRNK